MVDDFIPNCCRDDFRHVCDFYSRLRHTYPLKIIQHIIKIYETTACSLLVNIIIHNGYTEKNVHASSFFNTACYHFLYFVMPFAANSSLTRFR